MIRNVRSLWLATGLLLASVICASGLLAQTVDIPTAQVEATARAALDIGDAPTAYELAQAIVAEQPDNLAAQLILARAALRLGRPEEARDAAKTVWRQTRAVDLRYAAARLAAAASVELGQAGASKRWLSRSIALAPTPAARAQLRTDYAVVRNAAPTQANFSFTLYPSDNVNGGATNAFFVVDGVPFVGNLSGSAQALSGYEARLNYSLSHRVLLTDRARTSLTFSLNTRDVWLSDEARDKAPDLTNDDLAYRNAAIGVRQEWLDPKFPILWTTSAELGGIVSGGELQDDTFALGLRANTESFTYGFDAERRFTRDDADVDDDILTASLRHRRVFSFATLSLGASYREVVSDSVFAASDELSVDAYLSLRDQFGPFRIAGFAGISRTRFPDYIAGFFEVPGGRKDTTHRLGAEAAIPNFMINGFHPVVSLSAQRTDSNVSRFETEQFGLGFALRRAF